MADGVDRLARAVVVGVEEYQGGSWWDLDGPVEDAIGYARWLLESGMSPANLTLLLSPLARNAARAEGLGLPFRPADRDTVHEVLFRELRQERADFLLVAWSGHGLVDLNGRRRLLYADAIPEDIRGLDLDAALATYRSDLVPGFPRQLWLVDACQVFSDPSRVHGALSADPVPTGRPRQRPGQHALFACALGGTARNGATARSGAFSSAALELLRSTGSGRRAKNGGGVGSRSGGEGGWWPPDAERLATALRDRFRGPDQQGAAAQTPTYFWHVGPEGEGEYWGERRGTDTDTNMGTGAPESQSWAGRAGPPSQSGGGGAGSTGGGERSQPQPGSQAAGRVKTGARGGAGADRRVVPVDLEQRRRLVLALEAVPSMADPAARGMVLGLLPPEIASSLPRSPITRLDLLGVVETCLAFPDGLTRLWEAVGMVDSGTYALDAFAEALAEMPGFPGSEHGDTR